MLEVVLTGITHYCKDRYAFYLTEDYLTENYVLFSFSIEGGGGDGHIYEHLINNFVTSVEMHPNHNGLYVRIEGVTEGLKEYVNQVVESKRHFILE